MFSAQIRGVIRAFHRIDSIAFQSEAGVRAVILAVDAGLCRLVQHKKHSVILYDRAWNVVLGVELTDAGKAEMARAA